MTETAQAAPKLDKLDVRKFIFDVPLYERISLSDLSELDHLFMVTKTRFDGHCFFCGENSVLNVAHGYQNKNEANYLGYTTVIIECARVDSHKLTIFVRLSKLADNSYLLQKVGQYPSHADISNAKIKEYTSVLEKVDRSEITRGNGLAAHGVNIGAFVYLRRVFERLVYRHYEKSDGTVPKEDFWKLRMDEKIDTLKNDLPEFVTKNKKIYGVLSAGLHELSEDACGKYYELLLQSILLILDQEKVQKEKKKKEDAMEKALAGIGSGQPK